MPITASRRAARVEIEASTKKMDRGLAEAKRKIRALYREEQRIKKSASREVAKQERADAKRHKALYGGARSIGGAALGLGAMAVGGIAAGAMAKEILDVERSLTRFQIATDRTPAQMESFRAALIATSRDTGLARESLLEGAAAYVALTGDAAGAVGGMALFGKVANATGAAMADIAATAAAMKDNLGIDPKDFEAGFSALAVQGKAGAVELRELATQLAGVAPSFAAFKGGAGMAGLVEMGAALQVVRKGFGSSAEAATGMRALMVSIQRGADKFKKAGVRIYDKDPKTGKKRLRDFSDIIDSIASSKLAKDPTLLTKAFGSDEAKRAYDQLSQNRGLLDSLIAKSGDANAINRDAATYQQSSAARVEKAWNTVKVALAEAFSPEKIEAAVRMIERATAGMVKVVDFFRLIGKSEQEHRELVAENEKREAGIKALQQQHAAAGAPVPYEQARAQYLLAEAEYSDVRKGEYDRRSVGYLSEMRQGIASQGVYPRRDDMLSVLDQKIGSAVAREITAATAPLTNLWRIGAGLGVPNLVVKIGVDEIARASGNAKRHRTRPGGRT